MMEEALKDDRFSHILSDPKFRKIPKNVKKITLDKRFKGMFKDKTFKGKCKLDKRGRPLDLTPSENLKQLYEVSSESSEDEAGDENETKRENTDKHVTENSSNDSSEGKDTPQKQKSNTNKNNVPRNKQKNMSLNWSTLPTGKKCLKKQEMHSGKLTKKLSQPAKVINIHTKSDDENCADGNESDSDAGVETLEECNNISTNIESDKSDETETSDEESNELKDEDDSTEDDSSDEDSDDSSESKGKVSNEFDHHWEELRNEAPDTDEVTHRIAVCNMDWDRIRAEDLFACFNSFKPADGCINSVKIYPSEFGLKRMEEEKLKGPPELVEEKLPLDAEEDPEDKKGQRYHREKLRQYQINRLKYYYAVVDCDTPETANALYEQLNGMEYESSSVRFDLRFIPDDITFDHDPVSVAEKPPNPAEYKPRLFVTTALQQVKVNLTWDETDPKRRETLQKAFTEPHDIEKDIQDYLASSSSESEEERLVVENDSGEKLNTKDKIAKYRELLLSLEEKEKDEDNKYEMEITWEPGLKEKTEQIVKEKLTKDKMNPFEEMVQKKKEKKKYKRKELKAVQNEDIGSSGSENSDAEFFQSATEGHEKNQNSKKLAELALISDSKKDISLDEEAGKKKRRNKFERKKQQLSKDNFKVDVNDPRFSAIYSSHLYNIDPSDPHYKDTEGNRALIEEKQKKLKSSDTLESNRKLKKSRHF